MFVAGKYSYISILNYDFFSNPDQQKLKGINRRIWDLLIVLY